MIVATAAVVAGLEVQERRAAAAEERRLAGLLQLSVADNGSWQTLLSASSLPPTAVQMDMRVQIRNDGPRDVTVSNASAGRFVLFIAPVSIAAQATVELVLLQEVDCSAEAPPSSDTFAPGLPLAPGPLEITAFTSRGTRTITIAEPPYDTEQEALACALMQNNPPPPG